MVSRLTVIVFLCVDADVEEFAVVDDNVIKFEWEGKDEAQSIEDFSD